ncbi:MAG: hypothetical protein AAF633_28960 [Chloroflexota bacterium]
MIQEAILFGFLCSAIISVFIMLSFKREPRLWLHDFPKEMQAVVPPKTDAEKRLGIIWFIPITGSMFCLPLAVALWRHQVYDFTYLDAFVFISIMMLIFNVVDLVILDWLISVWWNPVWMRIEGTEEVVHYNSYWFHFKGFVIGLFILSIGAALISLLFIWL